MTRTTLDDQKSSSAVLTVFGDCKEIIQPVLSEVILSLQPSIIFHWQKKLFHQPVLYLSLSEFDGPEIYFNHALHTFLPVFVTSD